MRNNRRAWIGRASGLLSAGAFVIGIIGPAPAAEYTMKIGTDTVNDAQHEWMKHYAERVEKASEGRIKTELYPSGQLGGSKVEIKAMQLGTLEARIGPGAFLGGIDPRFAVLDAPGWFVDLDHARRTIADPKFRDVFLAMPKAKGIIGVSLFIYGPSSYVMRNAIDGLEGFAGKKIRIMGSPMQVQLVAKLGATAAPMAWGETLPALQHGTIDGVQSSLPAFVSAKFYDAGKYLVRTHDMLFVSIGMVSKIWFDKLPGELQSVIMEQGRAVEPEISALTQATYDKATADWTGNGGKLVDLPAGQKDQMRERIATVGAEVFKDQPQIQEMYQLLISTAKSNM